MLGLGKQIRIITINILTENYNNFLIHNDLITCRLKYYRRPFLFETYISNKYSNFDHF